MDVVILAAGKSTRMKSKTSKVLHKILGKPILSYVVELAEEVEAEKTIVVIAPGSDEIPSLYGDRLLYATQWEQKGTGDALKAATEHLTAKTTLVLYGDAPFLRRESLHDFIDFHQGKDLSILSVCQENPRDYGRIVRGNKGVEAIIEEKDCSPEQRKITEINSGILLMDTELMKENLQKLTISNAQGEYYLTDLVELFSSQGKIVDAFVLDNPEETAGINDRSQLAQGTEVLQRRVVEKHLKEGVSIIDPRRVYIEADVKIAQDVEIWPDTYLLGNTIIEEGVYLGPGVHLEDCHIMKGALLEHTRGIKALVGPGTQVGPFAYLRAGSRIGAGCRIGDFVEIKNSTIGDGTKVSHLSYVGDADLGKNINVGCGTIFVNYDGVNKHRSTVGDEVFIGCNSNLISPVEIGERAFIAAGTTVDRDVPENALSIGRVRSEIKLDWNKVKK
ncbi:MAG: bifunctional UDP-N-acetylglucosamine diphosphorylase/glucosamine-1-phosphate N-acetyltransferase GlmU [Tissierellia bacterium]|nr:bifunctional UDP-N-acetylglucosamine diphosphorylase/glucosamine-1-phosphate N-acetyltransferase GlmU [Tissierellia bacterium]